MSKIGKQIINLPTGVTIDVAEKKVSVKGPKGNLELSLPRKIEVKVEGDSVEVLKKGETKQLTALHGTIRSLINNMVKGVTEGFSKQLELIGTGFRAEVSGNTLALTIGFSHQVKLEIPAGISAKVEKNVITVEGVDKIAVGQFAADIRGSRPPEPYKGKGVKYVDEVIRRKPGKAAAKAGAAA